MYQSWKVSRIYGHYFSAFFELCNAVVNMIMSHSRRVGRFVELRDKMRLEVLKILVLIQLCTVCKDLTDLLAYGVTKLL